MDHGRVLALVRRTRRRLEATRLLRAASRGALVALVPALALAIAGRLWPASAPGAWAPWALLCAGAFALALAALFRDRIRPADAALFLDRELRTEERFVTVLGLPPGPLLDHLVGEIAPAPRRPRLPFPREIGYLPAALFVLFAAGLVPAASSAPPVAAVASTGAALPDAATPDAAPALAKLAAGAAPGPAEKASLLAAIDERLRRPEERVRARALLERAMGGGGAGASGDARSLAAMIGGSGGGESGGDAVGPGARDGAPSGAIAVAPYPEERDFLLAYRRHLAGVRDR